MKNLAVVLALILSSTFLRAGNSWKDNPTILPAAKVNAPYPQIDLWALLVDQTKPGMKVQGSTNITGIPLPSYLKIDQQGRFLTSVGNIPKSEMGKLVSFTLDYNDQSGDAGILGHPVQLQILVAPQWKNLIVFHPTQENSVTKENLKDYLVNQNLLNLKITVANLPTFISLDSQDPTGMTLVIAPVQTLPGHDQVGPYKGITLTATADGGTDIGEGTGVITTLAKPIAWISPNLGPFPVNEDSNLLDPDGSVNLKLEKYILHPESPPFRCDFDTTAIKPGWLSLDSSTCTLSGMPKKADLTGPKTATIIVSQTLNVDGQAVVTTSKTVVTFNVIHVNHAPQWVKPINDLPAAFTKVAYDLQKVNIKNFATDYDGDNLTFSYPPSQPGVPDHPAWLNLSANGDFTGTPQTADVTPQATFPVQVSDGQVSVIATFRIQVIKSIEPPTWAAGHIDLPAANEDDNSGKYLKSKFLSTFATDSDGDAITFIKTRGPSWLSIMTDGTVTVAPSTTISANDVTAPGPAAQVCVRVAKVHNGQTFTGAENCDISVVVNHVNHPPRFLLKTIVVSGKEGVPINPVNLNQSLYVFDQDIQKFGDTLTFKFEPTTVGGNNCINNSATTGTGCINFPANGAVSGTPDSTATGITRIKVTVTDSQQQSDTAELQFMIANVIHPATCSPVNITVPERSPTTVALRQYVSDPDADAGRTTLAFSYPPASTAPSWAVLSSDGKGTLSMNPPHADGGKSFSFKYRVTDTVPNITDCDITVTVQKIPLPPSFKNKPIPLGICFENETCTVKLADYVNNPDNSPLTYGVVTNASPAWVTIDQNTGLITIKAPVINPPAPSMQYTARFFVTDSVSPQVEVDGVGQILHKSSAPIPPQGGFYYRVTENSDTVDNLRLKIVDPDGDTVFCPANLASPLDPTWVTLEESTCVLHIFPKRAQANIGHFDFNILITDRNTPPVTTKLIIDVDKGAANAPEWYTYPVQVNAELNKKFTVDLRNFVFDSVYPISQLTFNQIPPNMPPTWFSMQNFDVSGTPTALGTFFVSVQVCNPGPACKSNNIRIDVKNSTPTTKDIDVALDSQCKGSQLDSTWIIDNSDKKVSYLGRLRDNIGPYFYKFLDQAEIKHHSLMLNADAHIWDGTPVRQQNPPNNFVMSYQDASVASDFGVRLFISNNNDPLRAPVATYNCPRPCPPRPCPPGPKPPPGPCPGGDYSYNSPTWDYFMFLNRRARWNLESQDFFLNNVPTETMIVTHQRDHYPTYAKNTSQASWGPSRYLEYFTNEYTKLKKSLRISIMGPDASDLTPDSTTGPADTYDTLRNKGGKNQGGSWSLYCNKSDADCTKDMQNNLQEYAGQVITKACAFNLNRFVLTGVVDATSIKVTIGNSGPLPGNTGSPTDVWTFDPASNTVTINWTNVDFSNLNRGDRIHITYKAS